MPMKLAVVPVTPFAQNCSVLWCEETKKAAVVDPGGDADRIKQVLNEHGLTVEKILVTHAHIDHAGAVADLAEEWQVPIEGPHKEEQFWIDLLPKQGADYGFPDAKAFTPTRWLDDGDQVTVGNITMDVFHCPGHTPGHVVFFQPDHRVAVVGDVLFQQSIGRTDFPRGDHQALVDAIRNKLFPLGDDVTFVPGHGALSTFGQERQYNPFVSDTAVGD